MKKLTRDMTQGSVTKNLILFSIPLCLSYFLQALYGSADALIVGQFATLGDVTGVTQGVQIINILTQGISGFTVGGTVLISRFSGAKKTKDLNETITTMFTLFTAVALGLTVMMLLCNNLIIQLMNIPEEAVVPIRQYLQICEIGILFIFYYNCISAVLQALGDSRHPLLFVGIACGVNVVLDLLFVAGFHMGAFGAAIATVISQMVSVFLSISLLRKRQFSFDFKPSSFWFHRDKLKLLLKLGIPYAVMRTAVSCSFTVVSGISNGYGLAASSAAGIVSKINNFATMPFNALQIAIATIAGQNVGAGQLKRAQKTMFVGLAICYAVGGSVFLLAQLFPRQLLAIFSPNEEMLSVGENFLRYFSIEYLLMPFSYSIHGLMIACGYTWIPVFDGLLAAVVFRVPVVTLCSKLFGLPGVAIGSSIAVLGAVIPAAFFYLSGIWKRTANNTI